MSSKHVFASVAHTIGLGSAAASATACRGDQGLIAAVLNTRSRIVGAAMQLGLNGGHARAVLGKSEGNDWRCDADGLYRL